MDIGIGEIVVGAALLALVGLLCMWVRAEDEPKTPWTKANASIHAGVFVSSILAGALGAWIMGYDIMAPEGFVAIVGVAGTGLAFLKGLVNRTG
ncbi:MAG: hypothetical protein WC455_29795 [Dehalococcoidia bacterium]|jgi:hypothetical protein